MLPDKNRILQTALWFLPTPTECVVYVFLCLATIFVSNSSAVQDFLYVGDNFQFHPIADATASINSLVERFVGERIAGSVSLAIFWGLIGLAVNVIWWVMSNFSTELNNDLVFSKYVHPKAFDPKQPLHDFVRRSLFRGAIGILAVFYLNFVFGHLSPHLTKYYAHILDSWGSSHNIWGLITAIVTQIITMHVLVVLTRFIVLRKRVFGS